MCLCCVSVIVWLISYQTNLMSKRVYIEEKRKNWRALWLQHCCNTLRTCRPRSSSALQAICSSMLLYLLMAVLFGLYDRPSVSLVGGALLYISCIVMMLCFWLFLAVFTFVFCNSSDSLSIYIASLYWYKCSNFNIHFATFFAISRSFKMKSKSCLVCIDAVISVLSLYLSSVVSWYSIVKWTAVSSI